MGPKKEKLFIMVFKNNENALAYNVRKSEVPSDATYFNPTTSSPLLNMNPEQIPESYSTWHHS